MEYQIDDNTNSSDIMNEALEFLSTPRKHELNQALISKSSRKNDYSVNRDYINSKAYRDKFSKLPLSPSAQQQVYLQAGRLLEFVNNLPENQIGEERLIALNRRTGELIVDNFDRPGELTRTRLNDEELEKIQKCVDDIIYIHNHSENGMPSGQDLLAYLHDEKVIISLIVCHNGDIYSIAGVSEKFEEKYSKLLEIEKTKTTEIEFAKRRATTQIYEYNERLPKKHKLFRIEKL